MKSNEGLLLLNQIESHDLLKSLIQQINKDADLAGLELLIENDASVEKLASSLYACMLQLLTADFGTYLNFLYRVDIAENTIKGIDEETPELIAEKVSYLILKREWQKIYFRSKNL